MRPTPREAVMFGKRWAITRRWSSTPQSTEAVRQQASDNIVTLLVGLGLGYALAWMIHGSDPAARGAYPIMPGRDESTLATERTEPA